LVHDRDLASRTAKTDEAQPQPVPESLFQGYFGGGKSAAIVFQWCEVLEKSNSAGKRTQK
jgi:hypothetical protein